MTDTPVAYRVIDADLENEQHQAAILEMLEEYARGQLDPGEQIDPEALARVISGLRDHPTSLVFLALEDELAVGFAVCFRLFSTFAGKPSLNIHDFAARATHRRHGVGRCLMAAIEKRAREMGCCKLTLEVLDRNEPAKRLYESVGFHAAGDRKLFWEKPLA